MTRLTSLGIDNAPHHPPSGKLQSSLAEPCIDFVEELPQVATIASPAMGRTTVREGPAQTNGHANSKATPKRPTIAEPNVHNAVLGNLLIKAWYPSFYPEELVGPRSDRLYVCQWCFRYSKELMPFLRHVVSG